MKRTIGATFVAASISFAAWAGPPDLGPGVRLEADGKPIDGEVGHLVPVVTDWNGDGKKDLLVGQFGSGMIRLYQNRGTDAEPAFKEPTVLEAGGKAIKLPAG
jgi:hypothetical protein